MKEKIKVLMKRAEDSLSSAELLFKEGYNDFSISRAYYAMFYAAEAALLTRDLKFSSHKSVITLFGQYFVKSGIFPSELGRDLAKAFDERITGDYSFEPSITSEMVKNAIVRTENFIVNIKQHLKKEGYEV